MAATINEDDEYTLDHAHNEDNPDLMAGVKVLDTCNKDPVV